MRLARNLLTLSLVGAALFAAFTVGGCEEALCVGENDFGSTVAWGIFVIPAYTVVALPLVPLYEIAMRRQSIARFAARNRQPGLVGLIAVCLITVAAGWFFPSIQHSAPAWTTLITASVLGYGLLFEPRPAGSTPAA